MACIFFIYSPPLIVYVSSKMGSVLLAEAIHKVRQPLTLLLTKIIMYTATGHCGVKSPW